MNGFTRMICWTLFVLLWFDVGLAKPRTIAEQRTIDQIAPWVTISWPKTLNSTATPVCEDIQVNRIYRTL